MSQPSRSFSKAPCRGRRSGKGEGNENRKRAAGVPSASASCSPRPVGKERREGSREEAIPPHLAARRMGEVARQEGPRGRGKVSPTLRKSGPFAAFRRAPPGAFATKAGTGHRQQEHERGTPALTEARPLSRAPCRSTERDLHTPPAGARSAVGYAHDPRTRPTTTGGTAGSTLRHGSPCHRLPAPQGLSPGKRPVPSRARCRQGRRAARRCYQAQRNPESKDGRAILWLKGAELPQHLRRAEGREHETAS